MYLSTEKQMTSNPLGKYFRRPVIYISLPTNGIFNPEIDQSMINDIGILPMTALDEISLRNPDALLNGDAMISLIRSCVPSIPDPKKLANIDIDALYLAIRYATSGKDIEIEHKCSKCEETNNFSVDINFILNKFPDIHEAPVIEYDDIKIHVRPPTIDSVTKLSLIEMEQNRILKDIKTIIESDTENKEEESAKRFYNSYMKIAQHNIDMMSDCILYVELPDGQKITNSEHLQEFANNMEGKLTAQVNAEIKKLTKKPEDATHMEITCPNCGNVEKTVLEVNPVNFSSAG